MATYKIEKIRAIRPSEKMSEKHPERLFTIHGKFHTDKGVALSITQKVVTFEDAKHPEFSLDLVKGILTLHEGQRGRKSTPSISQDEINATLSALRDTK